MKKEKKLQLAVLCGGQSAEHDISLVSAKNVIAALDSQKYDVYVVTIQQNGEWLLFHSTQHFLDWSHTKTKLSDKIAEKVFLTAHEGKSTLITLQNTSNVFKIDVVFPVLHGTHGEDGTVQGLLEIANVPYVGSGVLGSAICMDKDITKRLLQATDIPVANFVVFHQHQKEAIPYAEVIEKIGLPCFVKPANSGSSVGITKVKQVQDLPTAIDEAFRFDRKILIEQCIAGREIECAVLGNETPEASTPGEIVPRHEFYSYEAKYKDPNGADLIVPAKLPEKDVVKIQALSKKAFLALECAGMARIDFFVTPDQRIYLNEVNTIPGFTQISMYPRMWIADGMTYGELLNKLIVLALERCKNDRALIQSRVQKGLFPSIE